MPTDQHAQQPDDREPPPRPGRLGHEPPAAMTPERRALRDAWLAEMWPVCHEESSKRRRKPSRRAA